MIKTRLGTKKVAQIFVVDNLIFNYKLEISAYSFYWTWITSSILNIFSKFVYKNKFYGIRLAIPDLHLFEILSFLSTYTLGISERRSTMLWLSEEDHRTLSAQGTRSVLARRLPQVFLLWLSTRRSRIDTLQSSPTAAVQKRLFKVGAHASNRKYWK